MYKTVFGRKVEQTRRYDQEGKQIPVTRVLLESVVITQIKTKKKDGYNALQLGVGEKNNNRLKKSQLGHIKGANLKKAPLYFREVRIDEISGYKLGQEIFSGDVLEPGDLVNVTGISKGKGFTGVVKRWGFKTQPKTHGQSDRERAPGSIGQTTTPGRVFKGKKMPGRSGTRKTTVKNLAVLGYEDKRYLIVKGLVPGSRHGLLSITKVGEVKNFVPLLRKNEVKAGGAKKQEREKDQKHPENLNEKEKDDG